MQLAKAALSDLLQNLRVGTGLTQLNSDRPRHPVEQPYDRAASHQWRHPKTQMCATVGAVAAVAVDMQ